MVLTTIDDLSRVEIEFTPARDRLRTAGDAASAIDAQSAAFPGRVFTGRVNAVDSRIDPVSRAFRVEATLAQRRSDPAGGHVHAPRSRARRSRRDRVPEEALPWQGGNTEVFVVADDSPSGGLDPRGLRRNGIVEVVEGVRRASGRQPRHPVGA